MFTTYNQFNEGGCAGSEQKCCERKLFEGINPKTENSKIIHNRWHSSVTFVNVNSQWEKIRK